MLANPLLARWDVVAATQHALRYGGASLRNVPGLLKRVIGETLWQEYVVPTGEVIKFASFSAFVTSKWGLDTTMAMIERICGEDMETLDLLDTVMQREDGRPGGHAQECIGPDTSAVDGQTSFLRDASCQEKTVDNINSFCDEDRPTGTSRRYALRRLRKDREDIHRRVIAGELSPHQGMIEAGFRHKPTPLAYLHRYWWQVSREERLHFLATMLTPDERQHLKTLLHEEENHV